ncbi:MAG: TorF family putative porin [Giesbergeria sp.]
MLRSRPTATSTRAALAIGALCAGLSGSALAQSVSAPAPDEPEIQSYAIDTEVKFSSDRKTRGVSDTFNRPGAELTVDAVHESGLLAHFQLATVSKVTFPNSNRLNPTLALGWRGGNPEGLHYGAAVAREWFPRARVDAPTGFDEEMNPLGMATTKFNTSYLLGEVGYGIFTARYLYVASRDFRGLNTSTVCAGYLPAMMAGGDPAPAMNCYGAGFKNSRGSQLLDLDVAYPLNGTTQLIGHLGWQFVRHFSDMNTVDYRLGIEHTRWGFVFGAELAGAKVRNRELYVATDDGGTSRRLDRTAVILSVAKRF